MLLCSGNGAAVTFNIVDLAATTYTGTGSHAATLAGNEAKFCTTSGISTWILLPVQPGI